MAQVFAGGNGNKKSVFRFRRGVDSGFDKPYLFAKNNIVVMGTFGANGHDNNANQFLRVTPGNLEKVSCDGGKGEFARWEVELEGNNECRIKSKKSGKYLRIMNGNVDVGGGKGPFTLFKFTKLDKGNVALAARLESKKEGKFLCAGPKPAPFTNHYMFAKENTVVLKHFGGQFVRVDGEAINGKGGKGEFAQFIAQPQANGTEVMFKSKKTGKYLRIGPQGNLNAGGNGGKFCVFKVHKQGDGKVKLESKAHAGKYPAFRGGEMKIGDGGKFTPFEIFRQN